MSDLFDKPPRLLNVGLEAFAQTVENLGGDALHIDWRPPAGGDPEAAAKLGGLVQNKSIDIANDKAFSRYLEAEPVLEGVEIAQEVIPALQSRTLLHAGPPISWADMCGPMRGAIAGAICFEGWAKDLDSAGEMAEMGEVAFAPCHHHGCVGPMCGIVSPSMPVWRVRNVAHDNLSFATFNEGLGQVLRFGANSAEVFDRLIWMRDTLAPVLKAALGVLGSLELKPLIAQALHMGDEVHNRNAAATSLLFKKLAPAALETGLEATYLAAALSFISGNDHFFLNISMAACKSMMDAAHGVEGSTLVTAMARNGVEFGIRVSGCGDHWFKAPAPLIDGLYFPGYSMDDAALDLGDSTITETAGLGGFAMAAAPAIAQFVGGKPAEALANTREMMSITHNVNSGFTLPPLDFAGTPAGIDIRKVLDTSITPIINTGIAHKQAGVGQIGAGITRAPLACFVAAIKAFEHREDD